jgi:transposase
VAVERRYPSDLTDKQWELIEPLLPARPRGPSGRPRSYDRREIINAILYLNRAGCSWRMLPSDLPYWKTVYHYFRLWRKDGTLDRIHNALREQVRIKEGRDVKPTAGIVDSQSVKGADTVGRQTRGYDAGKKINGRKRHIVVDTLGLLLVVMVTAASIQDRAGGRSILELLKQKLPSVRHIFADGGYAGELVEVAKRSWTIVVEIVRRDPDQKGFAVLPRRWVVERTFAWLMRCRRLVRDYEGLTVTHEAFVKWGMIGMMLNRLAPPPGPGAWESAERKCAI